jgi:hypothetical protein
MIKKERGWSQKEDVVRERERERERERKVKCFNEYKNINENLSINIL